MNPQTSKRVTGPQTKFANLVDQGVRAYQRAQQLRLLEQTKQYLAEAVGIGVSTLESWRKARYPRDYTVLLRFAAVCIEVAPELDAEWVRELFCAAEMAGYGDRAVQALFGDSPQLAAPTEARQVLIVIRQHSLEYFPAQALRATLPVEWATYDMEEVQIDQSDLYVAGRLQDPYTAIQRQWNLNTQVMTLLARYPDAPVAYYGLAHIPLLFLAGYHLSNKYPLHFFDHNRATGQWELLQGETPGPVLEVLGLPEAVNPAQGEVVVRFSMSYEIMADLVDAIIPDPLAAIHIRLPQPRLDPITTLQQLQAYSVTFRNVLDGIHYYLPNTRCIHLFYAGPVNLALNCGRQISKTIHPRLIVYNYTAKTDPAYAWGIDITAADAAAALVITTKHTF